MPYPGLPTHRNTASVRRGIQNGGTRHLVSSDDPVAIPGRKLDGWGWRITDGHWEEYVLDKWVRRDSYATSFEGKRAAAGEEQAAAHRNQVGGKGYVPRPDPGAWAARKVREYTQKQPYYQEQLGQIAAVDRQIARLEEEIATARHGESFGRHRADHNPGYYRDKARNLGYDLARCRDRRAKLQSDLKRYDPLGDLAAQKGLMNRKRNGRRYAGSQTAAFGASQSADQSSRKAESVSVERPYTVDDVRHALSSWPSAPARKEAPPPTPESIRRGVYNMSMRGFSMSQIKDQLGREAVEEALNGKTAQSYDRNGNVDQQHS